MMVEGREQRSLGEVEVKNRVPGFVPEVLSSKQKSSLAREVMSLPVAMMISRRCRRPDGDVTVTCVHLKQSGAT
jgi:hypothetical protein